MVSRCCGAAREHSYALPGMHRGRLSLCDAVIPRWGIVLRRIDPQGGPPAAMRPAGHPYSCSTGPRGRLPSVCCADVPKPRVGGVAAHPGCACRVARWKIFTACRMSLHRNAVALQSPGSPRAAHPGDVRRGIKGTLKGCDMLPSNPFEQIIDGR